MESLFEFKKEDKVNEINDLKIKVKDYTDLIFERFSHFVYFSNSYEDLNNEYIKDSKLRPEVADFNDVVLNFKEKPTLKKTAVIQRKRIEKLEDELQTASEYSLSPTLRNIIW